MKNSFLLIFFLSLYLVSRGQNLVPNGSFEQNSACPTWQGQLSLATPWLQGNTAVPGGDYYNQCGPPVYVGVPDNGLGFQPAHSGVAYSGILLQQQAAALNVREYLECPLTTALVSQDCYSFEMYVNLGNLSMYSTSSIGVYFSDTVSNGLPNPGLLPFTPQIINQTSNPFDTVNWTLVSGNYQSVGGERYIIIGNFSNDSLTNKIVSDTAGYDFIYVYIDDVSLQRIPCAVGINERKSEGLVNIYPNPFINQLNLQVSNNDEITILIYDVLGQQTIQNTFRNSTTLNTASLAPGIYFYELRNRQIVLKKGKVVKE